MGLCSGSFSLPVSNLFGTDDFFCCFLILSFARTRLWLWHLSAPRYTYTSFRYGVFHLSPVAMWSVLVFVLWSFEIHVILWMFFWLKREDPIFTLFSAQKWMNMSPFSVHLPKTCGPRKCSNPNRSSFHVVHHYFQVMAWDLVNQVLQLMVEVVFVVFLTWSVVVA